MSGRTFRLASLDVLLSLVVLAAVAGCGGEGKEKPDDAGMEAGSGSGGRGTGGATGSGGRGTGGAIGTGGSGTGGTTGSGGSGTGGSGTGGAIGTGGSGTGGTTGSGGSGTGGSGTGGRGTGGTGTGGRGTGGSGTGGAMACTSAATCPAPATGNGVAACTNNLCTINCNTGYHRCGDACVLNTSVASCGNSCTPCSMPAVGGSATCSGTPLACGVNCTTGYHQCGTGASATCVVNGSTSIMSCGNNCTVCTAPANGTVTCSAAGACVPACNTGFHLCGTTCVADNSTSVSSCGTSCMACTDPANGSPTCTAATTGATPTCGVSCNTGFHACPATNPNLCLSNSNPDSCGTSCTPCPAHANAVRTCSAAGVCGFQCNAGFHLCNGACVANSAVATCGTVDNVSCTPCPGGATATCNAAGVCGTDCGAGSHTCPGTGTSCFPNDSLTQCGTPAMCNTCPMPSIDNAMAVCASNQCAIVCQEGFHRCPATGPTFQCVSNISTSSCGTSCAACPAPPVNGDPTCTAPAGGALACNWVCDAPGFCKRGTAAAPTCVPNDTADACGASCATCTTNVANAHPICNGGTTCGFECNTNAHLCPDSTCALNNNSNRCTSACTPCPTGETCVDNVCTP